MADGGLVLSSLGTLSKTPRGLLLLGLFVREVFSFWTGHPYDLEVWLRNAYFVSQGANPYTAFMPPVPGLSFAYLNETLPGVGYLPLWPLIVASLYRIYASVPGMSRFVLYFLLKQPPIIGDVVLGSLIYRALLTWGGKAEVALRGLTFWMVFPYAILISAIWGQFDAIVAALVMFFLLSNRSVRGYALVGLGILLKWLPLIYLPFHGLSERGTRKILLGLPVVIPPVVTALILTAMGWDTLGITAMSQSASHGGGGGLTYVNILQAPAIVPILATINGFYLVAGYLWIPGCIVAGWVAYRRFGADSPGGVAQSLLLITTVFFLTRWGVYEQYLIYFLPLFYIDVVLWHPSRRSLFFLTWGLSLAYLLVNNDLLIRFFGPVDSRAVDIAYAFDNQSSLAPLRVYGMYILGVLFTVHLVQLVRIFMDPSRDSTPWLLRPLVRLRTLSKRGVPDVQGGR
jgi:hypothetical protein